MNKTRKTKIDPTDIAPRATVAEYARKWSRLDLGRAGAPMLSIVPFCGRWGVVHIDRNGNAIGGAPVRVRDIIADFSTEDAARLTIRFVGDEHAKVAA